MRRNSPQVTKLKKGERLRALVPGVLVVDLTGKTRQVRKG